MILSYKEHHMIFYKTHHAWIVALSLLASSALPLSSANSALVTETEIVSGKIVAKLDNNAIKLDNQEVYHPSRTDLSVDLKTGESITLEFATDPNGEKRFLKFAPGQNSLSNPKNPRKELTQQDTGPK